ncbi:VOC family protein [Gordonia sp. TBRC 11910]|uniref:VOC family protein n=1 Tax=Gordonia asplenii TaxID=2725283 RepID=A0A848L264_9ACTN|nr:VOC family protein [Gordonia asplenii]NMO04944.1 VOC family protein [Gordonia asplenii]
MTKSSGPAVVESTREPIDYDKLAARRAEIAAEYLKPVGPQRTPSTARGIHHVALLSSDVETTVKFYAELLGFPLVEVIENRDYRGSTHFFFDVGNENLLAFFDLPGLDLKAYREVLGGLHHLAISISPRKWAAAKQRLDDAGVGYEIHSEVSVYFADPDGVRLELIADPLGEMYGDDIL